MSRLLFAAARGARIYPNSRPTVRVNLMWINDAVDHGMNYHIHPEDAHLAYGPISTALRKQAANDAEAAAEIPYIQGFWAFTRSEADTFGQDELHRALFLLILAEALADEGL